MGSALEFRTGMISPQIFYAKLLDFAGSEKAPSVSGLRYYLNYMRLYETLDYDDLADEIDQLERGFENTIYLPEESKKLSRFSNIVSLESDLWALKLSPKMWELSWGKMNILKRI